DCFNLLGLRVGATSYAGNLGANWGWWSNAGGANYDGHEPEIDIFPTAWPNASTIDRSLNGLNDGDGIFSRNMTARPVRVRDVTDGTGNTFLAGEVLADGDHHNAWCYANAAAKTCAIPPNRPGDPDDWINVYSFRSAHRGGLHFANADGSVPWVDDSI